jgi:hypothetical protein
VESRCLHVPAFFKLKTFEDERSWGGYQVGRRVNDRVIRRRRRGRAVWVLGVAALVTGLLYFEQVEIIYVLSVLGLCGFLLVVAFSDLDRGTRQAAAPTQEGDEAAPVVGVTAAAVTPAPVRRRAAKRRHTVGA